MLAHADLGVKIADAEVCQTYFSHNSIDDAVATMEFYNAPALSEDIWKKFDLLPTPPLSPSRDQSTELDTDVLISCTESEVLDDLNFLLEDVGDIEAYVDLFNHPSKIRTGLRNELLHDCMWSGRCTENCKQYKATDSVDLDFQRVVAPAVVTSGAVIAPPPQPSGNAIPAPPAARAADTIVEFINAAATAEATCVDPSVVSPYSPFNDHSYHQASRQGAIAVVQRTQIASHQRARHTKKFVGSETPSDSDDEDEEDDDDEEEIDVVTVAVVKQQKKETEKEKLPTPLRAGLVRTCRLKASKTNKVEYKKSRKGKRSLYQVSPAKSSTTISFSKTVDQEPNKRLKPDINSSGGEDMKLGRRSTASGRLSCGSRSSSDSEDTEKRREHNSMERKRRIDLMCAFQTLRENVPDISDNPKASKLAILTSAAKYCKQLTASELALERTIKAENRRQAELQKKLNQLRRNS